MPIYFGLSSPALPLTLESIGNRWDQEDVDRPNGYPAYHWLQTESGCGKIIIDNSAYHLREGEGVLIAPFVPHTYSRAAQNWHTAFATFTGTLQSDISKIIGRESVFFVTADQGRLFEKWVGDTVRAHEQHTLDAARLSVDCYAFLLNFAYHQKHQDKQHNPLYRQYVEPVLKQIEMNYHQAITLKSLAASVFISPQYLERLFKQFLNGSVYAYITGYRLNKAKELLLNDLDTEVQQVAYLVGYNDTSHFIAMFKAATGYTPLAFRKLH